MRAFRREIGQFRLGTGQADASGQCSMKTRAEASQVWPAANSTQACARNAQALRDRRRADRRSSTPTGAAPMTSRRTLSPEKPRPAGRWPAPPAARGRTCRSCSETRTRRRPHRPRPVPRRAARRGTRHRGYFRSSAARAGPSPTITLVPGRSRSRNASRFFSTATRPTQRKTGAGRQMSTSRGWNSCGIDAARPQHDVAEAARAQFAGERRRRRHHRLARPVKPAQRRPHPGLPGPARAPRHSRESGCGSSW